MVTLQIKNKEFEMLKAGTKKIEYRAPSKFNTDLLMSPDPEFNGRLNGNKKIKKIEFLNGYQTDRKKIIIEVKSIRLVKFNSDVDEPENNFRAYAGQFAIEIILGDILTE